MHTKPSSPALAARHFALLVASLPLAACFSGDLPEVVVTRHELVFSGVPQIPGVPTEEVSLTQTFEQDDIGLPDLIDPNLHPERVVVSPTQGATDLSFLTGFEVVLNCRDNEKLPATTLFQFARTASEVAGGDDTLSVAAFERPNLVDYWDCGGAVYDFTVTGLLPEAAWTVDVAMHLSGDYKLSVPGI